ncbi:hypothetical protein BDW22DRAFT_1364130 [Trametopsis cervina]|nr:hypothetical protein BDW22DRAFT_1364130 [Trametopsis cervina]
MSTSRTGAPAVPPSGYTSTSQSPAASTSSASTNPTKPVAAKAKAANVFSNDGSFLQRFQHLKKDEEEKKKQEETLARKREFDSRFKRRGKRPPPDTESSTIPAENPTKKSKVDEPTSSYQKEVQNYAGRSLKDEGIGVRPLVK